MDNIVPPKDDTIMGCGAIGKKREGTLTSIMDGQYIANEIYDTLQSDIHTIIARNSAIHKPFHVSLEEEDWSGDVSPWTHKPCLVVILVGSDPASRVYVNIKRKRCERVGITSILIQFDEHVGVDTIIKKIEEQNDDPTVHGIMVQLPLPQPLRPYEEHIINTIRVEKDVDGLTSAGAGRLNWLTHTTAGVVDEAKTQAKIDAELVCCTPKGIMRLLDYYDITLMSKHVVIINDSRIVGKPLATLCLNKGATVSVCNKYTPTAVLMGICATADILVVAVGIPRFISGDFQLKPGVILIDVGINKVDGRCVGDVDEGWLQEDRCTAYTPVPGGVGPMTVAMLLENTVIAWQLAIARS